MNAIRKPQTVQKFSNEYQTLDIAQRLGINTSQIGNTNSVSDANYQFETFDIETIKSPSEYRAAMYGSFKFALISKRFDDKLVKFIDESIGKPTSEDGTLFKEYKFQYNKIRTNGLQKRHNPTSLHDVGKYLQLEYSQYKDTHSTTNADLEALYRLIRANTYSGLSLTDLIPLMTEFRLLVDGNTPSQNLDTLTKNINDKKPSVSTNDVKDMSREDLKTYYDNVIVPFQKCIYDDNGDSQYISMMDRKFNGIKLDGNINDVRGLIKDYKTYATSIPSCSIDDMERIRIVVKASQSIDDWLKEPRYKFSLELTNKNAEVEWKDFQITDKGNDNISDMIYKSFRYAHNSGNRNPRLDKAFEYIQAADDSNYMERVENYIEAFYSEIFKKYPLTSIPPLNTYTVETMLTQFNRYLTPYYMTLNVTHMDDISQCYLWFKQYICQKLTYDDLKSEYTYLYNTLSQTIPTRGSQIRKKFEPRSTSSIKTDNIDNMDNGDLGTYYKHVITPHYRSLTPLTRAQLKLKYDSIVITTLITETKRDAIKAYVKVVKIKEKAQQLMVYFTSRIQISPTATEQMKSYVDVAKSNSNLPL